MTTISVGDGDPRHGTSNGYVNLACRCQDCRDAFAAHHLDYMNRHPEQREKQRAWMREYRRNKREAS